VGDIWDSTFGDKKDVDVPDDQLKMFISGESRPGGLFIHEVRVVVSNLGPYKFDAPRGVTVYGLPIGVPRTNKSDSKTIVVTGMAGAPLGPGQSGSFLVDKEFQQITGSANLQLRDNGDVGGACEPLQFKVDP
jgi:hypothetical protein